jgi:hypothetical protein
MAARTENGSFLYERRVPDRNFVIAVIVLGTRTILTEAGSHPKLGIQRGQT